MRPAAAVLTAIELCVLQALPQWSQQALQQHMSDAREVKTLEQLENGETGDPIWDAMQHQLKIYGTVALASGRAVPLPSRRGCSLLGCVS